MKKILLILCTALCVSSIAQAQTDKRIADKNEPLTWLGIDFSQLKFIGSATQFGDAGDISNNQLVEKYFPGWNELIINESEKFDVAKATNRAEVKTDISSVTKANAKLGKKDFFTDDISLFNHLTEADIKRLVSGYSFGSNKGLGLMFFVESMSKGKEAASIWVTFVDMDKKSVVLTKPLKAKSGGFGFRNYWAGSINNALKTMKSELKRW